MSAVGGYLVTCDTNNTLWTCAVWDPHTGTNMMTYKGGGTAESNTLSLIGKDYLAAVEKGKPLLHIWPVNSHQTVNGMRFVMPGRPSALAFSQDGSYCIAGINEKIYLWQMSSGNLLTIISRHYQNILHLKFTADDKYFVSAAEDGMVMLWSLRVVAAHPEIEMVTQSKAGQHDPVHVFKDHALTVTGIYISKLGMHGRLCTVSHDKTCKIYDLSTGDILLNLIFPEALSAVTMDALEFHVFVGTGTGKIHRFCLTDPPRNRDVHVNEDKSITYTSHEKAVTCLSVCVAGDILMSGSDDENVILWHIKSQEAIRKIRHKGPITNAFFSLDLKGFYNQEFSPSIILHNLQRALEKDTDEIPEIEILTRSKADFWPEILYDSEITDQSEKSEMSNINIESKYIEDLQKLQAINEQLYKFALNAVKSTTLPVCENGLSKKRKKSNN